MIRKCITGIISLLVAGNGALFARTTRGGQVLDCDSRRQVPYANVYTSLSGAGVTADSLGRFIWPDEGAGDSLCVSSVGYRTMTVPPPEPAQNQEWTICLQPLANTLPTATASAKRFRRESLYGNRSTSATIVSGWSVAPRSGAARGSSPGLIDAVNQKYRPRRPRDQFGQRIVDGTNCLAEAGIGVQAGGVGTKHCLAEERGQAGEAEDRQTH
ncbi:carboxypeptidase-like regulatory domain-containing protein [Neolewinella xylanilytica]|uniref:carboxypeptidase-like regulatory domain-containing protein n=1 Tax=Neolewinella xylanilytica TaxID=1514080 RepID=UPI0011B01ECA|nr:carboxypeptidase-like regulatory domain-containing protein [Neolewinella xylanilytica]